VLFPLNSKQNRDPLEKWFPDQLILAGGEIFEKCPEKE